MSDPLRERAVAFLRKHNADCGFTNPERWEPGVQNEATVLVAFAKDELRSIARALGLPEGSGVEEILARVNELPTLVLRSMKNVQEHTCGEAQVGEYVWWAAVTWPEWATKLVLFDLKLPAPPAAAPDDEVRSVPHQTRYVRAKGAAAPEKEG